MLKEKKEMNEQTRKDLEQAEDIIEQRMHELYLYKDRSLVEDLRVLQLVLNSIKNATETITHQKTVGSATHLPCQGEGHHGNITRTPHRYQGS